MKKVLVILLALAFAAILLPGCPSGGGGGGEERPFTISQSGGNGVTGNGGGAGYIDAECYGPKGVQFVGSEAAMDTSVPAIVETEPEFGDSIAVIEGDLTVPVYCSMTLAEGATALTSGELFMVQQIPTLYFRTTGAGGEYAATGLQVLRGATLILGLNYEVGGQTGQDTAHLELDHDVEILGTVTVKALDSGTEVTAASGCVTAGVVELRDGATATARDSGSLYLRGHRFYVRSTGVIDTSGDDGVTNERGGYGGSQFLQGWYGGMFMAGLLDATGGDGAGTGDGGDGAWNYNYQDNIELDADEGVLVNTGEVDASGGDGVNGGNAGEIYMESESFFVNKGEWRANGGYGSNGYGGDANTLEVYSYYSSLYNTAKWEANGGDGENGDGGDGGTIDIYGGESEYVADTKILNDLSARGGYGGNGDGGYGGDTEIYNYSSGTLILKGDVDLTGGDCAGAACSGGEGGDLYMEQEAYYDYENSGYVQASDLVVRGNITLDGGDGVGSGGSGGYLELDNTYDEYQADFPQYGILLAGYHEVIANGGDGIAGGSGGYIDIYTYANWWNDYMVVPPGPIRLPLDYFAAGGEGTAGTGGAGGDVYLEADPDDTGYVVHSKGKTSVLVSGDFLLTGGNGTLGGGNGGYFDGVAYDLVRVNARIDTSGGDGTSGNANGGSGGGDNYFYGTWDVKLSGSIVSNGGDASGTGTAGSGADIYASAGQHTQSSMQFTSDGGLGSGSGWGGDGGDVEIFSGTVRSIQSAPVSVLGGDGLTPGDDGDYLLDGTYMIGYH